MDKDHIIREIRRTTEANGGVSLGWRRFETETGIGYHDWYGKLWTRWGDAVSEAGLVPNKISVAYSREYLLQSLCLLTRQLGHVPVEGELRLSKKSDSAFPSDTVFRRCLGSKQRRVVAMIEYCESNPEFEDVAELWGQIAVTKQTPASEKGAESTPPAGYVYLLKHGSRREYKIGRTNNAIRREGELRIELPEKVQPVHYIETDDPPGIEAYWHNRFASKRKQGEWFELTADDVRAFKRWKRIH